MTRSPQDAGQPPTGDVPPQAAGETLRTTGTVGSEDLPEVPPAAAELADWIDSTGIATIMVDRESRLVRSTPAARMLFALGEADIGRPLDALASLRKFAGLQADVDGVAETGTPVERQVVDGHGDRRFVMYVHPRRHAERIDGIVLSFVELTGIHKAGQLLEDSEERYRAFVTASSDAVYQMSPDWREMRRLDGRNFLPDVVAPSKDWMDTYIDAADQERVRASIDEAIRSKRMFELDHRVIRADGTPGWTHSRAVPILGRDGAIAEWIGTASDVTAVKEAERDRRASEERLRSAIEVARVGTWDWDVATGEIAWSDEHFRMNGYQVGEVVPSYEAWIVSVHPDDREGTRQALQRARDTQQEYIHEYRSTHRDGSTHNFYARGRFVFDDAGQAIRMFGAMIEVTAARELEQKQNVLVGELQHRTRNLIGVVRSIADKTMQSAVDLNDFQGRFGARLDALARVQGLLSRVDEHNRVTFDELLRVELAAHGVTDTDTGRVVLDGPEDIPLRSGMVQMLAMALHELATNAGKYGALHQPDGRLRIGWRTLEAEGVPTRLEIRWQEHGVTMPSSAAAAGRTGQGRELIERALPYQLDAETHYELGSDGVLCIMIIPISGALHD